MKFLESIKRVPNFLKEAKVELAKVKWPSRKETIKYTLIVIGVSLVVAFFLGTLDFLFSWLINKIVTRN